MSMEILKCGAAVISTDSHHKRWIEEAGTLVHDRWFADEICKHIKPGDVVIDGGANIGTLTRAMLDAGGRVIAFEPNMDATDCLRHNCSDAIIFPCSLSDESGWRELVRCQNAGATHIGKTLSGFADVRSQTICQKLDSFWTTPSLIKLDIEGYETKALRGARETIARCRPVLIVEVNSAALERAGSSEDELIELIDSYGYSIHVMQDNCKRGDPQYDVECLPK